MGCHFLLQGFFPTQGSNPYFLHLLIWQGLFHHCSSWKTQVESILHLPQKLSTWASCLVPSDQFSHSVVSDSATAWTIACQASLSITKSWSLTKLMCIESVMPSNHLILWCPLLLPPSIFPSIRVFSNESVLRIRWPNFWSFSFRVSPSNAYSGMISFRVDWLDLLACPRDSQESSPTPQFNSINSSALSFLYSPTLPSMHDYWKNHSLD